MSELERVAIIGLGSMGLGMARSLIRAGHPVSGCDISAGALDSLTASGGQAFSTPAEAAKDADIVVVVVVNAAQTETVLYGAGGAVAAMKPGSVIISSATVAPAEAKSFAARALERDVRYLDAPISGGSVKADAGKLTVMASGAPEAFAAAKPALDAMAETVYTLGDDVGIGSSFKIVNQLLAGVHIAAACEAITFAKSLDLDISKVFEVISKSAGNSWMFENRIPHVLAGDYTPHSAVSIFTKDLGIVSDLGRKQKFPLPIASAALQLFVMTEAAGMGRDDDSSVARLLAQIAGLELPGMEKGD
ncbi:3-hydroxyisobutyrate dehydrogenase [Pararhizobium polonicum]|uniref:L-threonate dehydrogenase n=1 Tax=Pararhizobium polonicum TaxID=1612624 RepID=A0A1C7P3D7_9HYPH|nr:L-threonate dehydrogenase [Pararhizobium polonicum]OBZ95785.1 3-hydroxyisobutyrate dehydrogenase [Pararhizobium polonicum]